ncbi:unnamed protein product, partial [Iphiclides podalirius]
MFACTVASVGDAGALAAPPRDAAREWTMASILIGRWGDVCLDRQALETLLVSGQWPLFSLDVGAMFACTAASVGDAGALAALPRDAAREWTMASILIGRWGDVCLDRQVLETLLVSGQWPLFSLDVGAMFACTAASVGDAAREWTMASILIGRWVDVCLYRGKCWRRCS